MQPIVCVGDVHEGIGFGIRVDPDTGISERALDLHRNFVTAAKWAIDNHSALFCVLGDMFDRSHVAPTFREMVRRDIIEPLGKAGIEVWLLAGNHDQPRSFNRATSLDDYRGYAHVKVIRRPSLMEKEIGGKRITFIVMPYLHPDQVVELAREKLAKDVPPEEVFETAKGIWREWVKNRAADSKADWIILFGHFEVEGAQYSSITTREVMPGDTAFGRDLVPPQVNLAVFGHIHKHQVLWDRLVYAGAPERIDWGERLDDKGFVVLHPEDKSWEFVKLPVREMLKINVAVDASDDPTAKILASLPRDVAAKMFRIEVSIPETMRGRVDERMISDRLKDSFSYEFRWTAPEKEKIVAEEFTLDPVRLLRDFISQQYREHPRRTEILEEGERFLKGVLEK